MDTGYTPTLQNDSLTNSTKVYLLSILGIRSTYQKRSILRNGEGKKKKKKRKILYTHTSGEAQNIVFWHLMKCRVFLVCVRFF